MTRTNIASALAVIFIAGTAMAQPPATPAPVARATGNPAKAVPLNEAVRGLIEMCTDYAGKPEIPFTEDKIRKSFPEDRTNSLGIVLQGGAGANSLGYHVTAPTIAGVMMGTALASGSCMFTPVGVDTWAFYSAFNAAFDSSTSYVSDARDPRLPTAPGMLRWRSQKVLATTTLARAPGAGDFVVAVRISQALDQPGS